MKVLIFSHSPDMKIFQHLHKHVSIQVWIYLNHASPSTYRRPLFQYVTPMVRLPPTMCCLFVAEKQHANHASPLYPANTSDLSTPPLMGLCEGCVFKQFLLSFEYSSKTEKQDSTMSKGIPAAPYINILGGCRVSRGLSRMANQCWFPPREMTR